MEHKKYYTTDELAKRWGYSKNTIACWRSRGVGPKFFKRGYKAIAYWAEDIAQFEQENPGFVIEQ
jgi:hypothetical protein